MADDSKLFIGNVSRLQDPGGCASGPRQLHDLQEKISQCMTRLFQKPGNGGNPFLFSLAGPKPHYLCKKLGGKDLATAATDGKSFFWNPDFLVALENHQVSFVMSHESNHVLFFHCTPERAFGKDPEDWNIAVDFTDNAVIEKTQEKAQEEARSMGKTLPALWGGRLGDPIQLRELLDWIDGKLDTLDKIDPTTKKKIEFRGYSDITLFERSPDSVYAEIQNHKQNSPRKCKACSALSIDPKTKKSVFGDPPYEMGCCPKCGSKPRAMNTGYGSMDSHITPDVSKEEVMSDMMRAAEQTAAMGRGSVPSEIEAALAELRKPTLSPHDIIVNAFQRKALDVGANNDWTRLERRPQYLYEVNDQGEYVPMHRLYKPKKYDYSPKWVALIDTSGSMSDQDIANGVKEIQAVASIQESEGWVVPCDAVPYWDQKVQITTVADVKRTKIVGRGGTVFDQFFKELPDQIGADLDVVVIITDGDCGAHEMSVALRPPCDILWIITNKREFKPAFGRVVQLEPTRH